MPNQLSIPGIITVIFLQAAVPVSPLTVIGIIHTIISVLALVVAFFALYRDGRIIPASGHGILYILLTAITCLTAFPIMKTGHFTAAHAVGVIVLVLLPIGEFSRSIKILGKGAVYVETFAMSTTLFLSLVPAIIETLTRLPVDKPIANGPNDPIIQTSLMILVGLYVVGMIYQFIKIRSNRKSSQKQDKTTKFS